MNPPALQTFSIKSVFSKLYSSFLPNKRVTTIPNIQIKTVRHTSAMVLETGLITFEIVTAIGTETEIETKKKRMKIMSVEF